MDVVARFQLHVRAARDTLKSMAIDYRELAFRTWAPPGAAWSPWAKPVMFANAPITHDDAPPPPTSDLDLAIVPPADGRTAIVVDVPALDCIGVGLLAAGLGYRPVPVFNAVPRPSSSSDQYGPRAIVELMPAAALLLSSVERLASMNLPNEAPPAFLLDSQRRGDKRAPAREGDFDNRSISLTTDFPSAAVLSGSGIQRVLLICDKPKAADDLAHTLRRWQDGGLKLSIWNCGEPVAEIKPLTVPKPSGYRLMFQRWLATLGLRRSPFGGFGGTLPSYSGGGFGGGG